MVFRQAVYVTEPRTFFSSSAHTALSSPAVFLNSFSNSVDFFLPSPSPVAETAAAKRLPKAKGRSFMLDRSGVVGSFQQLIIQATGSERIGFGLMYVHVA